MNNEQVEKRLRDIEELKHGSYDKRTEHLDESGRGVFINRLIEEDSPYLLQHAHNPVNWYAWGDEAFAAAQATGKPIFLSIGYSTCHWCHVMEVESFDNSEVAAVLNEHFISIKMDREQYPDIDEVYMTGVQLMTGQGGWPMSNLLLPTGEPFFGATYFPAAQFIALLQQVVIAWDSKRGELETSARQMQQGIEKILGDKQAVQELDADLRANALQALFQREDRERGGLAGAPKFPQEPLLLFLLDQAAREQDPHALSFVDRALEGMGRGGIYDQVGGGFARYSVDEEWLVPHFEKMLYNQSQLGLVYLQAYRLTAKPFFLRVLTQTLDYVLRDMQRPSGGFYSATDADSEGEEGVFFTWSLAELRDALDAEEFELVRQLYGPDELGNFEGSNILELSRSLEVSARETGDPDFYLTLDKILEKLYLAREQRVHPLRDDKLIVAWSGAMINTLAQAGARLAEPRWTAAALKAAEIICSETIQPSGKLWRIALNGAASINGQLEDYANLIEGLVALFDTQQSTGERGVSAANANLGQQLGKESDKNASSWLARAQALTDTMIDEFWDPSHDGFFLSPREQVGPRLTRSKSASDGATLSPIATALRCLLLLDQRRALLPNQPAAGASKHDYAELYRRGFNAVSGQLNEHPLSHSSLLRVQAEYAKGPLDGRVYLDGGLASLELIPSSPRAGEIGTEQAERKHVVLALRIADGWHIAANETEGGSLPLRIEASEESAWALEPVALTSEGDYRGAQLLELTLVLKPSHKLSLYQAGKLNVTVQICSESQCLLAHEIGLLV
ncbi:MAG: thioredoxin domain-containing protein [Gammaproteobacteria bacterium]|nr:thioredoxin domain-containing protein [Gammaproteobacteria bacterium]